MKSKQVLNVNSGNESEQSRYSDLKVMQSAAGWYVGTTYQEPGAGYEEPGSRDTGYFATQTEALRALVAMENGVFDGQVRLWP